VNAGRDTHRKPFSPLEYHDPAPAPWLIHALGVLNRWALLPGLLRIVRFDLPAADERRLRGAVNRDTAAFLGPNHPEFLSDWLVDKELSRRVSPLMAHWASYEIVNASPLARAFWLASNLIANVPGGSGKAYSVAWALEGHGVLLHPEGTATWQCERVGPLLPGLVDMAWDAAERVRAAGGARPVWLVPIAWRYAFRHDPRRGLARDMAALERGLSLPRGDRLETADRFAALMRHLLARQCERLDLAPPGGQDDYFAAQTRVIAALARALAGRYGELDADLTRALFQIRRAMRERADADPDGVRRDRARVAELQRLAGFDPALYDRAELAPERIAEVLKRTRSSLLTRGFANALHNTVPVAAGPRTVHVRVAEPVAVRAGGDETEGAAVRAALLAEHRARLQATLDQLGDELAASGPSRRVPNLLHRD
jgi:hypothetical protein